MDKKRLRYSVPLEVSLPNHELPFDRLRANGDAVNSRVFVVLVPERGYIH
jgi:hypothetical protein